MNEDRFATLSKASAIASTVAAVLALFGGVGIWGISLSLIGAPDALSELTYLFLQLASSLQSLQPALSDRLVDISDLLSRLGTGDLSNYLRIATGIHSAVTFTAAMLGLVGLRRRSIWPTLISAVLVVADVSVVWAVCVYASQQLYLALESLAEGNPWAVGRGVAGLSSDISLSASMIVAVILAIASLVGTIICLIHEHRTIKENTAAQSSDHIQTNE
jgi:hypothetical protein